MALLLRRCPRPCLAHIPFRTRNAIHQRADAFNLHLQFVAGIDGAGAARCTGEDQIPGLSVVWWLVKLTIFGTLWMIWLVRSSCMTLSTTGRSCRSLGRRRPGHNSYARSRPPCGGG